VLYTLATLLHFAAENALEGGLIGLLVAAFIGVGSLVTRNPS